MRRFAMLLLFALAHTVSCARVPAASATETIRRCCAAEITRGQAVEAARAEATRLGKKFAAGYEATLSPTSDSDIVARKECSYQFVIGFVNPTDTAAEVEVDACTGAIRTATLGGGL